MAGVSGAVDGKSMWDMTMAQYDHILDINVKGLFNYLGGQLRPGGLEEGASIVNAASIASFTGVPSNSIYSASKHAVLGLTRSAAKEAGPRTIRVNAVAP